MGRCLGSPLPPARALTRGIGRLCDARLPPMVSRRLERAYTRLYRVEMNDVVPRQSAYPSFDAFFTRPLRTDARPIGIARVTAPADGRLVAVGELQPGARFRVKAQDYEVHELIGENADGYIGGSYAVIYLAPGDYHRVHAPVDGSLSTLRGIPGDFYPVNTLGERHVPRLLVRNERVVLFIDTPDLGRVAVVLVGAFIVGRITVPMLPDRPVPGGDHPINPAIRIARGDEIGTFHLGSTVVVLVGRHLAPCRALGAVQYGQPLLD
jgi:phosphatidylserine decarboxylase